MWLLRAIAGSGAGVALCLGLLAAAGCSHITSREHAKESVLKEDLYMMRSAIDQYAKDEDRHPTSLKDLIDKGYLSKIPVDPMTGSDKTWLCEMDSDDDDDSGEIGIVDLHSASERNDNPEVKLVSCP